MHWIDPGGLPETAGVEDCLLRTIDGEVDGFVLTEAPRFTFRHTSDAPRARRYIPAAPFICAACARAAPP
jgi:hypothetical protein